MKPWPPELDDLKTDMKIDLTDTREDDRLTMDLDAAIAYVTGHVTRFRYEFIEGEDDPVELAKPAPTDDVWLGTIRYAVRLNDRRRSKDGMIPMGEMGATRVASYDYDIDRLLGIGKFRPMSESFA